MKTLMTICLLALFSVTTTVSPLAHEATSHPAPVSDDDIVDVAIASGSFNTLVKAVQAAGLVETLRGDGPFTVFAPTDDAFSKLPSQTLRDLLRAENKDQLIAILTYHVVPGRIEASDLLNVTRAKTLNGKRVPIGLRVGEANVIATDIEASNGIIHVIDTVLMPSGTPSVAQAMMDLIDRAINRGAPLYNRGQTHACASIYEVTAEALLALGQDALPTAAQRSLRRGLQRASQMHSASDRAWTLRYALDDTYEALQHRKMRMATR